MVEGQASVAVDVLPDKIFRREKRNASALIFV